MTEETLREAARRLAAPMLDKGFKPEGLHEYTDANGTLTHARVRAKHPGTGDKWIRPIARNGATWEMCEPTFPNGKPLYRLHQLVANPGASVWWTEGEQKADALAKLGLIATTSGGCTSHDSADFSPLAKRSVIIWPDNDTAEREHAARVAMKLRALGCAVATLDVAPLNLPPKGDAVDWLKAHPKATAAEIEALPRLRAESDWPEPLSLVSHDKAAPYPLDALPGGIGAAVREVVDFVQCPAALAACSALTALSTVAQGLVNVRRSERLESGASLYFLAIAESGERKSTVDEHFTRPIREWEAEQAEKMKPDVAKYAADLGAWDAKRDGLRAAIRQATTKSPPKRTQDFERELRELEAAKPTAPKVPRLIFADITPEKLGECLAFGWPSGAVISAEAGIVFGSHALQSDSQMRSLALLNSLWSGETFQSDRRTAQSYTLRGARLSMGLAAQPETARTFFEATKGLARGSGFAARFLIAWPTSTQGDRPFREAPPKWPHVSAFHRRLGALLDMALQWDERGILKPTMLDLSPEARTAWIEYHDEVERELRPGGDMAETKDVASKSADNAARLAAVFHVYEHGPSGQIGLEAMRAGCTLAAWHLYEARRFLGELAMPVSLLNAQRLDGWLLRYCAERGKGSVTRKTAQRLGPSPLRDGTALEEAIAALSEAHRVRLRQAGREKWLDVNPALIGSTHGPA